MVRDNSPFMSFRFALRIPAPGRTAFYDGQPNEVIGLVAAYSDPFTDAFWISRGHFPNEPTLARRLAEAREAEVWMFQRHISLDKVGVVPASPTRRLRVTWDSMKWYPLDLDATKAEVACEWVALEHARYGDTLDVALDDAPIEIRQSFKL